MKLAEKIHTGGRKFYSWPYRVYYLDVSEGETQSVIISGDSVCNHIRPQETLQTGRQAQSHTPAHP